MNMGPGPFPHLAAKAKRYRAIASDLDNIAEGRHPRPETLADAPLLVRWCIVLTPTPHLLGTVYGHPTVADGKECLTSLLLTCDPVRRYARTENRFYRLGPRPTDGGSR